MSWTHSICDECWGKRYEYAPTRVSDSEIETCCFCGLETKSGICIRYDPEELECQHSFVEIVKECARHWRVKFQGQFFYVSWYNPRADNARWEVCLDEANYQSLVDKELNIELWNALINKVKEYLEKTKGA